MLALEMISLISNTTQILMAVATSPATGRILTKHGWKVDKDGR